jgi:hypothetical protein
MRADIEVLIRRAHGNQFGELEEKTCGKVLQVMYENAINMSYRQDEVAKWSLRVKRQQTDEEELGSDSSSRAWGLEAAWSRWESEHSFIHVNTSKLVLWIFVVLFWSSDSNYTPRGISYQNKDQRAAPWNVVHD